MTPSQLEAMVRNLNTRTTAIEQILPTLVTKDDLKTGLDGVEARLGVRINGVEARIDGVEARLDGVEARLENRVDGVKSHVLALIEKVKADYDVLARHLANVPSDIRRLTEQVAGMSDLRGDIQRLTEQVSGLARKIDDPPRRRR